MINSNAIFRLFRHHFAQRALEKRAERARLQDLLGPLIRSDVEAPRRISTADSGS